MSADRTEITGRVLAQPTPGRALIVAGDGARVVVDVPEGMEGAAREGATVVVTLDDSGRPVSWRPAITERSTRPQPRS